MVGAFDSATMIPPNSQSGVKPLPRHFCCAESAVSVARCISPDKYNSTFSNSKSLINYACEVHDQQTHGLYSCDMLTLVRYTPTRCTPAREVHASEVHACEVHTFKVLTVHVY